MPRTAQLVRPGRLHTSKAFSIPGLPGSYPLTVYLPHGYDQGKTHYPVAYVFDGQNLYGDAGTSFGGWHLHHTLDAWAAHDKRVPIVIGIHHGGASRAEDQTPWPLTRGKQGRGDRLLDWVSGPLAAMVAEELRILKGPEHTLIGGSSLGGLMALYGFCKRPDVFGSVLAMSPSLWVKRGAIFEVARQAKIPRQAKVYLDYGGREGGAAALQFAEQLAAVFAAKGLVQEETLLWRPDKQGTHSERAWRRRLPKAIRFLYP